MGMSRAGIEPATIGLKGQRFSAYRQSVRYANTKSPHNG